MSTLNELNELLFDTLMEITNEDNEQDDAKFEKKLKKANAIAMVSSKIIDINKTVIMAEKVKQEYGIESNNKLLIGDK